MLALFALVTASGCALTSNAPPVDARYFRVDPPPTTTLRSAAQPTSLRPLALGPVRGSAFLRNRIVYREPNGVLGTYEEDRWTEYPEVYLRRFLQRELFGGERFEESLAGDAPTLEAELVRFEEVRRKGDRAGHVEVAYRLRSRDRVLASDVVVAERAAPKDGGVAPLVEALDMALGEVTARIAQAVTVVAP